MRPVLFIDRDGTIILEPEDEQIDAVEKFAFYPGAISSLKTIASWDRFDLVLVTNQDGLGTSSFPEEHFWPVQNLMIRTLEGEGVHFANIHIDRTLPEDGAATRKPGLGMLRDYLKGDFDLAASFVIGDRASDVQLANNLGCGSIRVAIDSDPDATFTTTDWPEIVTFLRGRVRTATQRRKTRETDVQVKLHLDGSGTSDISTGLGFLDHMLDQIVRQAKWDLRLKVDGDLAVDEHHTMEDTAITLGEAVRVALGEKRGIQRYGSTTPMDESLADVSLDLSGRSTLVWDVVFTRERIGDVPTEMFEHFFQSFCDAARCTLHILAKGRNEHHLIESIYKGVGRVFGDATRVLDDSGRLPSTKGVL